MILLPLHLSNCSASMMLRLHVSCWHDAHNTHEEVRVQFLNKLWPHLLSYCASMFNSGITFFVLRYTLFYYQSFTFWIRFNSGLSRPALVPIQFSNQSGLSELHWVLHLSGASVYLPSPDTLHGGNVPAVHAQFQRENTLKINNGATSKSMHHLYFVVFFFTVLYGTLIASTLTRI